jgi:hypothetical protein
MRLGSKLDTARARERRALDELTGRQPLRRRAVWVERLGIVVVLAICILAILGGLFAVRGIEHASGRQDPRVTAVTVAAAQLDPSRQTEMGEWVADVTWTDPAAAMHRGHVSVPGDVAVGTPVPARLASNGVVRSTPEALADVVCVMIVACLGIALVAMALALMCHEALCQLADRMRRDAWGMAWAQWNPTAPNREEL